MEMRESDFEGKKSIKERVRRFREMEINSELVEEYLMLLERFRRESLLAEHFLQKSYWTRTNTDTHTHTCKLTHTVL